MLKEGNTLKRRNLERIAAGRKKELLKGKGFKEIEKTEEFSGDTSESEESAKDISGLKADELRALAKEKGIEGYESLTTKELREVLKGVV